MSFFASSLFNHCTDFNSSKDSLKKEINFIFAYFITFLFEIKVDILYNESMMISYLFENPILFFILVVCLVISITIHEFFHAYMAFKLGDSTPKLQGRVTLNPVSHVDPLGLVALMFLGFGWGRPVEYDIYNLRNPKRDVLLISFVGPLSNLVLAFICFIIINFFGDFGFLQVLLQLNLVLFVFNLIPVFPLDGFNVVRGLLPYQLAYRWGELEQYGIFILIGMILFNIPSLLINQTVPLILSLFNFLI